MISINIYKNKYDDITRYNIEGHANFGPYGEDIVCAGVSILSHTALLSLIKLGKIDKDSLDYTSDEEKGYFDINLPKKLNEEDYKKSQIVLRTFEIGVKSLVEAYPDHITLKYREV